MKRPVMEKEAGSGKGNIVTIQTNQLRQSY